MWSKSAVFENRPYLVDEIAGLWYSIEMLSVFFEIYKYRQMIFSLVHKELRGKYKGAVLGFFWTFLNPLLQLFVYTFVFFCHHEATDRKLLPFSVCCPYPLDFYQYQRLCRRKLRVRVWRFGQKDLFSPRGNADCICY